MKRKSEQWLIDFGEVIDPGLWMLIDGGESWQSKLTPKPWKESTQGDRG